MVLTPGGLRLTSSVLPVPDGGSINISENEIQLLDASKNIVHTSPVNKTKAGTVPEASGWITYASWVTSGPPISYFNTFWTVPPAPVTYNGQTIYLFNSLLPANGEAILQPVLQYGPSAAGGGAYWTVANWYVTESTAYYSPLTTVNVGDILEGIIEIYSWTGSAFSYVSLFVDIPGQIQLNNSAGLVWATETLESYGVTTGTDYPEGHTVFSSINLIETLPQPSGSWSVSADDLDDGLYTTVVLNGATNAEVVITYPT